MLISRNYNFAIIFNFSDISIFYVSHDSLTFTVSPVFIFPFIISSACYFQSCLDDSLKSGTHPGSDLICNDIGYLRCPLKSKLFSASLCARSVTEDCISRIDHQDQGRTRIYVINLLRSSGLIRLNSISALDLASSQRELSF